MTLTPGQVADLRSTDRVRGVVAGVIVYTVSVSFQVLQRAQELSAHCSMPPEMTWYVAGYTTVRVELHSSMPEWFAELEMRLEDARRQR